MFVKKHDFATTPHSLQEKGLTPKICWSCPLMLGLWRALHGALLLTPLETMPTSPLSCFPPLPGPLFLPCSPTLHLQPPRPTRLAYTTQPSRPPPLLLHRHRYHPPPFLLPSHQSHVPSLLHWPMKRAQQWPPWPLSPQGSLLDVG